MDVATPRTDRSNIRRILEHRSPFVDSVPDSSEDIINFLLNQCKVLIVGAGGLGCELLKDIALMGIRDIHVLDMDTIELSNLNRQFLFRTRDIGRPKAEVAAEYIKKMIPDCKIAAHYKRIEELEPNFYASFNVIICGLDSVEARRWINNMMVSLLRYDANGELDQTSVIPLIDGGTEGLKGNARLVLPGITACIECNLDLYPPTVNYPLCTIANKPRLPEHTIEYAKTLSWAKEQPFGNDVQLNTDDIKHIEWIHREAVSRAKEFKIQPPTFKFTQSVIKHTIPAVSSTNACVAATCAMEAFKLITSCANPMNNFQMINLGAGVYTYVFETEKNDDCIVCGRAEIRKR